MKVDNRGRRDKEQGVGGAEKWRFATPNPRFKRNVCSELIRNDVKMYIFGRQGRRRQEGEGGRKTRKWGPKSCVRGLHSSVSLKHHLVRGGVERRGR